MRVQTRGQLISIQDGEDIMKYHMRNMMTSTEKLQDSNNKWQGLLSNGPNIQMLVEEMKVLYHTLICTIPETEHSSLMKNSIVILQEGDTEIDFIITIFKTNKLNQN